MTDDVEDRVGRRRDPLADGVERRRPNRPGNRAEDVARDRRTERFDDAGGRGFDVERVEPMSLQVGGVGRDDQRPKVEAAEWRELTVDRARQVERERRLLLQRQRRPPLAPHGRGQPLPAERRQVVGLDEEQDMEQVVALRPAAVECGDDFIAKDRAAERLAVTSLGPDVQ